MTEEHSRTPPTSTPDAPSGGSHNAMHGLWQACEEQLAQELPNITTSFPFVS